VSIAELEAAQETAEIVSVQNLYNLANRASEDVLDHCERHGIAFIPWFPLATGKLAVNGGPLGEISATVGASASQLALAWLLHHSPVMLPIPGTSSVEHLEDNLASATIELTDESFRDWQTPRDLLSPFPRRDPASRPLNGLVERRCSRVGGQRV
jgi:pyridoxine 4-dehydrogenase